MKVLFAAHGYKPAWRVGGPILSVSGLAESLVRKGHAVTVFTTNANLDEDLDVPLNQPVDVEGVEVWYFQRKEWLKKAFPRISYLSKSVGFLYAPEMASRLEERVPRVDVVHTHLPFNYPTYAAAHAAFRHGKPLFYHQRSVLNPVHLRQRYLKKKIYLALVERDILKRATTLIALTEAERESYQALGISTPVRIIPNGIDASAYRIVPVHRVLPSEILESVVVILFLGRLHPRKGANLLLDAFLRICERFPSAVLVMAGPDEWGLEAKYRADAAGSPAASRIFFPGMVDGETKLDLLARADLFCLPSDAEGFSMAILEALASGTAVLISPGCHLPQVETAGVGWVAERDPKSLAVALSDLLSRPSLVKEMKGRARPFVVGSYSWDAITDKLEAAYVEGIDRQRRR